MGVKVFFLILLMSCSTISSKQDHVKGRHLIPVVVEQVTRNDFKIEKEFIKHVEVFEKYYGEEIGIEMSFAQIPGDYAGICFYSTIFLFFPEIVIDYNYWINSSETEREMTILHELGHCILGRGHVEEKENSIPVSLMYKRSFSNMHYELNREEYIKELFNLVKKPMIDPFLAL